MKRMMLAATMMAMSLTVSASLVNKTGESALALSSCEMAGLVSLHTHYGFNFGPNEPLYDLHDSKVVATGEKSVRVLYRLEMIDDGDGWAQPPHDFSVDVPLGKSGHCLVEEREIDLFVQYFRSYDCLLFVDGGACEISLETVLESPGFQNQ